MPRAQKSVIFILPTYLSTKKEKRATCDTKAHIRSGPILNFACP